MYREQDAWFAAIRSRLLRRADILNRRRVLDLGTGTGETLCELRRRTRGEVVGVDRDAGVLALAGEGCVVAEASELPFANGAFDLVFTQMFFLWAAPLDTVVAEIRRVLQPGAPLIVCAEPDYGGRMEYPRPDPALDAVQRELVSQGADLEIARKLPARLAKAGFRVDGGTHPAGVCDDGGRFQFLPYFWYFVQ